MFRQEFPNLCLDMFEPSFQVRYFELLPSATVHHGITKKQTPSPTEEGYILCDLFVSDILCSEHPNYSLTHAASPISLFLC